MGTRKRHEAVNQLFDLPDLERSLKAQPDGLQTGDEIDEPRSHRRAVAAAHSRRIRGELKINAAILEQPVIEKILTHLGLQARAPPRAPARRQALQGA